MTSPQLLTETAPSVERAVVSWLTPLGRTATRRKAGDPLPFRLVARVAGADDPVIGIDTATVSVHTLAASPEAALNEATLTHRRIGVLAVDPTTEISLLGSAVVVAVDYCTTLLSPMPLDYQDPNVARYVARYEIGISYTPV